jgi:hypothetical protein
MTTSEILTTVDWRSSKLECRPLYGDVEGGLQVVRTGKALFLVSDAGERLIGLVPSRSWEPVQPAEFVRAAVAFARENEFAVQYASRFTARSGFCLLLLRKKVSPWRPVLYAHWRADYRQVVYSPMVIESSSGVLSTGSSKKARPRKQLPFRLPELAQTDWKLAWSGLIEGLRVLEDRSISDLRAQQLVSEAANRGSSKDAYLSEQSLRIFWKRLLRSDGRQAHLYRTSLAVFRAWCRWLDEGAAVTVHGAEQRLSVGDTLFDCARGTRAQAKRWLFERLLSEPSDVRVDK